MEGVGVVVNIQKLKPYLQRKSIRAETLPEYEKISTLGVSNKLGITETSHKRSKDLSKYQLIESGDFAYNPYRINVGSIGLVPFGRKGLVSPAYVVFSTNEKLLSELLFNFLKSREGLFQIGKYARGTVRKALRFEDLCQIEMRVPPIEIQKNILKRKKSIQSEVEMLEKELTHHQLLLKKLRQSILQEAIKGKLTADYRQQNPNVEPAMALLARIQAEKKQLIKDKEIKKQNPLLPINEEEKPFELPEGWIWCRLEYICNVITDGDHQAPPKSTTGIPFVVISNIKNKKINFDTTRFVPEVYYNRLNAEKKPQDGDLLYTVTGSFGMPVLLTTPPKFCVQRHIGIIKPNINVEKKYLLNSLNSPYLFSQADKVAWGVAQRTVPLKGLRNFLIPLPPLPEQKAIATKVEKLLSLCDQLETQITSNQTHAEQLIQSVLKEAFSQNNSNREKKDNILQLEPPNIAYYKLMILAVEIIDQLHNEPTLGHLKLQKMIFLCQKLQQVQLPTNFLKQAAGPYDPEMARFLAHQLPQEKWFEYKESAYLKYKPLENAGTHKADFMKYFDNHDKGINKLINLFRKEKSDWMQIVATLYACWEEILEKHEVFSETLLIERFYLWSEEKSKFKKQRLIKAISWMYKNGVIPYQKNTK